VDRAQLEAAAARVLKGRFQFGQFDPKVKMPWDSLTADAVWTLARPPDNMSTAAFWVPEPET
jgi:hypothetical protein